METLTADRSARRLAIETYRTIDAFDTVSWRAPSSNRSDSRRVNDDVIQPTFMEELKAMPGWIVPVAGGFAAGLMGMMLGGALAV